MTSVTSWIRFEPHSRAANPAAALEFRLADPAWMLGRQWQFGEFAATDGGSPVWAECSGSTMPLSLVLPGPVDGHQVQDVQVYSGTEPLDATITRERTVALAALAADRRLAAEAGWQFAALLKPDLAQRMLPTLRQAHAIARPAGADRAALDAASLSFLDLMAGRALDGLALLKLLLQLSPQAGATALGFAPTDAAEAVVAITDWLAWVASAIGPLKPPASTRSAWIVPRMEYAFAVAAPADAVGGQFVLEAAAHDGDPIDWYSVDLRAGRLAAATGTKPASLITATLPTGVTFKGMPSRRLWEFEDAQVNLAAISAAATDLTRMLYLEFLLQYGNDFFVLPIDVAYGNLCRVDEVRVTDSFGTITTAKPFADPDWRLFELTSAPGADKPGLFLPPVLPTDTTSKALESVQFMRDEMANLCWGIERVVQSAIGAPLDRFEAEQARRAAAGPTPPPVVTDLTYQLDTWNDTNPGYWYPFVATGPGRLTLQGTAASPLGRLLPGIAAAPNNGLVYDEEVPRAGVSIERRWHYTRWSDGQALAWVARRRSSGRGEGSSGLAFDVAKPV
jgi:hypothetical protein